MKYIVLFLSVFLFGSDVIDREYSYLRDVEGNLTFNDIVEKEFTTSTENNFGTKNGIYWLRIDDEVQERSILEFRNSHASSLVLYDSMGAIIPQLSNARFPSFCLINDAILYPLYLKVDLPIEALFSIQNVSEVDFAKNDRSDLLNIGFFYGTSIALMIATLLFFVIIRNGKFLFLSLTILAIAISVTGRDNILQLAGFTSSEIMIFESFGHFLVGFCATGYLLFYIKVRKHQQWIKNSMIVLSSISFLSWLLFASTMSVYAFIVVDITCILTTMLIYLLLVKIAKGQMKYILMIIYPVNTVILTNAFVLHTLGITLIPVSLLHVCIAAFINFLLIAIFLFISFKSIQTAGLERKLEINKYIKQIKELDAYKEITDGDDSYMEALIYQFKLENIEVKVLDEISKGRSNAFIEEKYNLTDSELESITNSINAKLGIENAQEITKLAIN